MAFAVEFTNDECTCYAHSLFVLQIDSTFVREIFDQDLLLTDLNSKYFELQAKMLLLMNHLSSYVTKFLSDLLI